MSVVRLASMIVPNARAGFHRSLDAFAGLEFLADTLENQHVRVDRHADGQHNTGDARQGEGGVGVHDAHQNEQVEYQREVSAAPANRSKSA